MEKVKLPKSVVAAIRLAEMEYASVAVIVKNKARGEVFPDRYDELNGIDLDTLTRALYVGCEVERTPEEKVRDIYNTMYSDSKHTVRRILDTLGIKIEGVNS